MILYRSSKIRLLNTRTYWRTRSDSWIRQILELLLSFAIRHVCNFCYPSLTPAPKLVLLFLLSPFGVVRCMRLTLPSSTSFTLLHHSDGDHSNWGLPEYLRRPPYSRHAEQNSADHAEPSRRTRHDYVSHRKKPFTRGPCSNTQEKISPPLFHPPPSRSDPYLHAVNEPSIRSELSALGSLLSARYPDQPQSDQQTRTLLSSFLP